MGDGVAVGVALGVGETVTTGVGVGEEVAVGVGLAVGLAVGVGVAVGVGLGVGETVGVGEGVGESVTTATGVKTADVNWFMTAESSFLETEIRITKDSPPAKSTGQSAFKLPLCAETGAGFNVILPDW